MRPSEESAHLCLSGWRLENVSGTPLVFAPCRKMSAEHQQWTTAAAEGGGGGGGTAAAALDGWEAACQAFPDEILAEVLEKQKVDRTASKAADKASKS